ncbi:MAG: hypothetical protein EOO01_03105 [Chitinophagaceae bacterium]|nr:MAG: hypothetical protein EOO01_03105 [Chitinophagaceae bacterium]
MAEQLKQVKSTPNHEIEALFDRASDYFDTRLDLFRLKAVNTTSDIVSSVTAKTVFAVFAIVFWIVVNIGIALLLGETLGKSYYGFFIMAAVNLIAGLFFLKAGGKWVKGMTAEKLIKKIFR